MKKGYLISIIVLIQSYALISQEFTQRNDWLLAGSVYSTNSSSYGNEYYGSTAVNPKVGYFVIDRLVLGMMNDLRMNFSMYQYTTSYYMGPFIRLYTKPARIQFFSEVACEFTIVEKGLPLVEPEALRYISLALGLSYNAFENIALETSLTYKVDQYIYRGSSLIIGLGMNMILKKRQK